MSLLDTGACRSLVSKSFVNRLGIPIQSLRSGDQSLLLSASNSPMPLLGRVTLPITINGFQFSADFFVLSPLAYDVILGADFLQQNKAYIDYANHTLSLFDNFIACPIVDATFKAHDSVCVATNVVLPPMTESIVPLEAPFFQGSTRSCLIEPLYTHSNCEYVTARSLVLNQTTGFVTRMLNPTNKEVVIPSGTFVGSIVPIYDKDILTTWGEDTSPLSSAEAAESLPADIEHLKKRLFDTLGIEVNNQNLTSDQMLSLLSFLDNNRDMFAQSYADLPGTDLLQYVIDTGDAKPIRQRAYKQSPSAKAEIERQVEDMLQHGIIEESNSPWSSPCLLVKKHNNEMRFCVDYRKLNKITTVESFPLPILEDFER